MKLVLMMLWVGEGDELLTVKNYCSIFNRQKLFQTKYLLYKKGNINEQTYVQDFERHKYKTL